MPHRLIVTRPAREALRWVETLRQAGIPAEALPLIDIAPLQPGQAAAAWQKMDSYAALMFVSANAVEHFFAADQAAGQSGRAQAAINTIAGRMSGNSGVRFMAPGPGTVAALLQAGVAAAQIDAPDGDADQFDSEALWRVVGGRNWQGKTVLIVRGDSAQAGEAPPTPGRDWLARQWHDAGATVDFVAVYQRQAPQFDAAQQALAQLASSDGSVWLFSSSEAVSHLVSAVDADWAAARAIATHPRIAQTLRAAGWGVVAASRPDLHDIKAAFASIESAHDE